MKATRRYPFGYTILAGLAGAIAWGLPYPISPFLRGLPVYESPPFQVPLARLALSYALAGIIAGSVFLFGIRSLPINREHYSRPSLTPAIVLSTEIGLAFGGVLAILIGLLISASHTGYMLAASLGIDIGSVEPGLSAGWVLGTALAAIIIRPFTDNLKQAVAVNNSPALLTLKIALRVAGIAFLVRLITCLVEFSSFITYTLGNSIFIFILFQIISGIVFGTLIWNSVSKIMAV